MKSSTLVEHVQEILRIYGPEFQSHELYNGLLLTLRNVRNEALEEAFEAVEKASIRAAGYSPQQLQADILSNLAKLKES